MYGVVRRYEAFDESRRDELIGVIRDEFIPRLKENVELQAYYVIDEGSTLATVTICDTRESAESSTSLAAEFIRERNLSDALPNPPQVTAGNVSVHKVSAGAIA